MSPLRSHGSLSQLVGKAFPSYCASLATSLTSSAACSGLATQLGVLPLAGPGGGASLPSHFTATPLQLPVSPAVLPSSSSTSANSQQLQHVLPQSPFQLLTRNSPAMLIPESRTSIMEGSAETFSAYEGKRGARHKSSTSGSTNAGTAIAQTAPAGALGADTNGVAATLGPGFPGIVIPDAGANGTGVSVTAESIARASMNGAKSGEGGLTEKKSLLAKVRSILWAKVEDQTHVVTNEAEPVGPGAEGDLNEKATGRRVKPGLAADDTRQQYPVQHVGTSQALQEAGNSTGTGTGTSTVTGTLRAPPTPPQSHQSSGNSGSGGFHAAEEWERHPSLGLSWEHTPGSTEPVPSLAWLSHPDSSRESEGVERAMEVVGASPAGGGLQEEPGIGSMRLGSGAWSPSLDLEEVQRQQCMLALAHSFMELVQVRQDLAAASPHSQPHQSLSHPHPASNSLFSPLSHSLSHSLSHTLSHSHAPATSHSLPHSHVHNSRTGTPPSPSSVAHDQAPYQPQAARQHEQYHGLRYTEGSFGEESGRAPGAGQPGLEQSVVGQAGPGQRIAGWFGEGERGRDGVGAGSVPSLVLQGSEETPVCVGRGPSSPTSPDAMPQVPRCEELCRRSRLVPSFFLAGALCCTVRVDFCLPASSMPGAIAASMAAARLPSMPATSMRAAGSASVPGAECRFFATRRMRKLHSFACDQPGGGIAGGIRDGVQLGSSPREGGTMAFGGFRDGHMTVSAKPKQIAEVIAVRCSVLYSTVLSYTVQ